MITFKMKALSIAVLGLAGLGMAGVAAAACPSDPAQPNGAWSSKATTQGTLAIVANPGMGLDTSTCRLGVSLNQNAFLIAKSFVTDTSPANETHYRARFYIDVGQLATGLTNQLRSSEVFNASATSGPANVSGEMVAVSLVGNGGVPAVIFTVGDTTQGSNFRQVTVNLPSTGANRIEIDLPQSANATFRYWVSDAAVATTDGAPTGTITGINNTAWSGVKQASLGLFSASNNWRSTFAASNVLFLDEFDSRRQTFIGQ